MHFLFFYRTINGVIKAAPNGFYNPKDGSIWIDLNAGNFGQGTMMYTIAHELSHFIKQWSPVKFKALADFLVEQYGEKGVSVDTLVRRQMQKAKDNGRTISYDVAFEEMVADSMESMLTDGKVIKELYKRDKGLFNKIKSWIDNLVRKLNSAYKGYAPESEEGKLVTTMKDSFKEIQTLFIDALQDASSNFANADVKAQKNTTKNSGDKYSERYEAAKENNQILGLLKKVENGDFKANEKAYLGVVPNKVATDIYRLTGINVYGFKMVVEARQLEHIIIDHGKNGKADKSMSDNRDIAKMEYIINNYDDLRKSGKTQAYSYMKNGRNKTADTVLYEKQIGSKSYYVVQAVPDTKAKTLYVVSAFIGKSGYKKETSQLINANSPDVTAQTGSVVVSNNIISNPIENVKENSEKQSARDVAYIDAVNRGDAKAAQELVDEAAKRAGYTQKVYHGTDSEFTEFNTNKQRTSGKLNFGKGIYLTPNKNLSEMYTETGNVMELYASVKNPYEIFGTRLDNTDLKKLSTEFGESVTLDNIDKVLQKNGYDGIIARNYNGSTNPINQIVVFSSNQVKSADPITYDDKGAVIPLTERFNPEKNDIRYSERDYPIDADVENIVKRAATTSKDSMMELSDITSEQNKAINRLVNQTNDDSYRGKYAGGKHKFSNAMIKHALKEHGDFLREGLRAQLPINEKDIARHLSAIKDNKMPSNIKPTKTKRGNSSIVTSYKVNGYTLYAEEIIKPLGKNKPSDLIGYTMYKAPTLATAAALATSARALPKRQSSVLCNYYMPNNTGLSTANFVADENGNPAELSYIVSNNGPKVDTLLGGLIALSSSEKNFTDKSKSVEQGYVMCKKPFYITNDNRVFSNSDTDVSARINELKKQGYDCFIFDKVAGDNYMVAVINKAQIIKNEPTVLYSDRDANSTSARSLLVNSLEGTAQNEIERKKLNEYKSKIALIETEQKKLTELRAEIKELSFAEGPRDKGKLRKLQDEAIKTANRINIYDRQLLSLEATKPLQNVLNREKELAKKKQKQKDEEILKAYKEKVANERKETIEYYKESRKKAVEGRNKTEMRHKIKKVVNDLNKLLLKGTKEKHVMVGLQKAVAAALDAINMDTVSADERVAKYDALIAKETNPEIIASLTESRDRIQSQGDKLSEKLSALKEAYNEIKNSTDESVNSQYDEIIFSRIESVQKKVGNISLRNMTLEQLQEVYDLYTMVLTSVRNSNKAFAEDIKITRMQLGSNTLDEIKDAHKAREYVGKVQSGIEKFMWQNMKPMTSVKHIRRLFYT
ncbi:MAG: hypothetical protein J6K88_00595 [Oscillospiraceae bacterium]|nr:hypothetical protein [Oscillospiraceae bacterium]